jgi:lipopolysaccharide export system protein LptA
MASLKRIWTVSLACGGLLFCGQAVAQIAPGTGDNGPTAITADKAEQFQDKHMYVWTGAVEVVQNGARLVSDKLTAYTYGPGEGPNGQGKPPAAASKGSAAAGQDDLSTGSIKQMIAEGHVFYVTQNENVRGDNGVYDAEPDTITMTGNVIAVQGKNVVRGDKMVMDRKTGKTTVISNATGRSNPNRVRAVIYNDNQNSQGQGAQGQPTQGSQGQKAQGQTTAKAPAAPAKKP